jgi:hypothetical protein
VERWTGYGDDLWIVECRGHVSVKSAFWSPNDRSKKAYEQIRLVKKVGTQARFVGYQRGRYVGTKGLRVPDLVELAREMIADLQAAYAAKQVSK